jgi:acetyltransferase-like isoleucine patch superfamily enzyme
MDEKRVDIRERTPEEAGMYVRQNELLHQFNHTVGRTEESRKILKELLGDRIGENTVLAPPLYGAALEELRVGDRVFINSNLLAMARGGITIEDDVQIAANVQLLSNNHDPYDRQVLTCRPVRICKGAWIGAGASILPGVTVGRHAIVGAASVVTHDVGDYEVVAGKPAKCIRKLDPDRFPPETEK